MSEKFIFKKANKQSIARRQLVNGVGINDSWYVTSPTIDGKVIHCPFYQMWTCMMTRCYSPKYHSRQPTYKDCYVCDSWLIFSSFREWAERQHWKGRHLDKDLIKQGNKVYAPEFCMFVSKSMNNLMLNSESRRGKHPQGVCFFQGKFAAQITRHGKYARLGMFDTEQEASNVYKQAKVDYILELARCLDHYEDVRLKPALIRIAKSFRS